MFSPDAATAVLVCGRALGLKCRRRRQRYSSTGRITLDAQSAQASSSTEISFVIQVGRSSSMRRTKVAKSSATRSEAVSFHETSVRP